MENENQTLVTEFILTGLFWDQRNQILFFVLFLSVYLLTVLGNIILICAVISSSRMHTPMYYFLCNLSCLDLFYSSTIVPKMLQGMLSAEGRRISIIGCMIQMGLSLYLAETECILLVVMAYDRYIAICSPLRYRVIMNWNLCKNVTVLMGLGSFLLSTLPLILNPFIFCHKKIINHFVCEILAVLKVACGDLSIYVRMISSISVFTLLTPFGFILVSYTCIITTILKIHSVEGRTKAFSTCASHLTVVLMFYGTCISMYMGQSQGNSQNLKYITVVYGTVTPMLNPLIYSLRNRDVKEKIRKLITKKL
ncbi:olfactory receptor 13-like [Spea bombifrons]|uniref:olfactory receptor 13-like n=1 Tax=Spea bombifrons TaxID=233779 RepID=UPI00234AD204|nr:olfactory receptor 13-like [Spea bombifrons]